MNWTIGYAAIVLLIVGLVGQAFEMKKIRQSIIRDEDLSTTNVFGNRRNFKWYAIIGLALVLWYLAERT